MGRATLVTGAAGFAGSHLLDLLSGTGVTAAAGETPRRGQAAAAPSRDEGAHASQTGRAPRGVTDLVAWHRPGGAEPRPMPGVTWQAVDLLDKAAVGRAIAALRPSAVYHCAGAAHVGRSWSTTETTFAVNVRGTHHLIESLRDSASDARVLIPSSALVYAPAAEPLREDHPLQPASPYGLSKLAQELVGTGNPDGPQVCIARPFNHFGPRQDPWFVTSGFARRIADIEAGRWEPEIAVGNLDARRDLTDVRDTVRAYRLILEDGVAGRPYNVCAGHAVSIRDVLHMLLARARVTIRVVVDPARYRPNDQPVLVGDPARVRSELGWTPVIPLPQTLDDLLDYWRTSA
jgi:GDP-4-dehydro-6-deoxy-D-mannose reductase